MLHAAAMFVANAQTSAEAGKGDESSVGGADARGFKAASHSGRVRFQKLASLLLAQILLKLLQLTARADDAKPARWQGAVKLEAGCITLDAGDEGSEGTMLATLSA